MSQLLAVARKDLQLAGRTRDTLFATAFYVALVLLVLGFALGAPEGRSVAQTANLSAGALWTALTLASAVAAGRAYSLETESGALESLLLYPAPPATIYLGKLLGTLLPLLLIAALTIPAALLLFGALDAGLDIAWGGLLLVTLLGVLGLSAANTFYAALTVNLRSKEALLPALAFPPLIPLVIAAVRASSVLLTGGWTEEAISWTVFLLAFDLLTLVLASWLFAFAVEG